MLSWIINELHIPKTITIKSKTLNALKPNTKRINLNIKAYKSKYNS